MTVNPFKLKHLDIENFKSYKGFHRLGPIQRFNVIVGPNGSGKSNLVDAISFVLGEISRDLRVKKLSDLIHGASVSRPVTDRCSCAIVFTNNDVDVTFRRVVKGNGSEYLYNDKVVSQAEYLSHLKTCNVNVKANNFLVHQGSVESIALKDGKELACIFDEVSGSIEAKKDAAKQEQIVLELQAKVKSLAKDQAMMNSRYKTMKETDKQSKRLDAAVSELESKKLQLTLHQTFHLQQKINEKTANLTENRQKRQSEMNVNFDQELAKCRKKRGVDGRATEVIQNTLREKTQAVNTLDVERETEKMIKSQSERAGKAGEKKIVEITRIITKQNETIREKDDAVRELNGKMTELMGKIEQAESVIKFNDQQRKKYDELCDCVEKETHMPKKLLDKLEQDRKIDQDILDLNRGRQTVLNGRVRLLTNERKRLENMQRLIRDIQSNVNDLKEKRPTINDELNAIQQKIHANERNLRECREQIENYRLSDEEIKQDVERRKVVKLLKENFTGVHDYLVFLCNIRSRAYHIAATKAFGKHIHAIVVDRMKTAEHCVTFLRTHKLNRITFLPLDNITPTSINDEYRHVANTKLLYDLITCDEIYEPAVRLAVGNMLVASDVDVALAVARTGKHCVCVDGTMFKRNGMISGGLADLEKKSKIWTRKQAICERENVNVDVLNAQSDALIAQLRKDRAELRVLTQRLNELDNRLMGEGNRLEITQKTLSVDNTRFDEQSNAIKRTMMGVFEEIRAVEERMSEQRSKIESIRAGIDAARNEIFADFCREINVNNINECETNMQVTRELYEEKLRLEIGIDQLQNEVACEKKSLIDYKATKRDIQAACDRAKNDVERSTRRIMHLTKLIEAARRDENELKCEVMEKRERLKKINEEIVTLELAKKKHARVMDELNMAILEAEKDLDKLAFEKKEIVKDAMMDGVEIPLAPNTSLEMDDIQIDFTGLSAASKAMSAEQADTFEETLVQSIATLQDSIAAIQLSKDALTLQQLSEQLTELNATLAAERQKLKDAQETYKTLYKEQLSKFNACFRKVSDNINAIYRTITCSETASASLTVDDPTNPTNISYYCTAPGKHSLPMSCLSGGEQAMAALALLFAIHSFNPAPIFVLDEIDAPLDSFNMRNVAEFLRDKTGNTQILIVSLRDSLMPDADLLIGVGSTISDLSSNFFLLTPPSFSALNISNASESLSLVRVSD